MSEKHRVSVRCTQPSFSIRLMARMVVEADKFVERASAGLSGLPCATANSGRTSSRLGPIRESFAPPGVYMDLASGS